MSGYTLTSLLHYVLHGLFEFSYLFQWRVFETPPLGLGQMTFGTVGLLPARAFGMDVASPHEVSPHLGIYQGLWGPLLADFGMAGMLIASLAIGILAGRLFDRAKDSLPALIAYAPLAATIFVAPFFNAFAGAYGLYTLLSSFAVAGLLTKSWRRKPSDTCAA
jgi:hypothetical protein